MGRKRPIRVQFCMSEDEKKLLDAKTELSGLSKRAVLMLALQDVPIVGSEMLSELKQINLQFSEQYRLLKNMANNLNQIAKICNRFFYTPDALELTKLDIKQCWAEALVKYKSGDYTLDLSKEAKELLKVVQDDYTPEDSRVGLIKKYLDGGNFEYVCAKQIWSEALHMDTEMKTYDSKDIGSIMNNQIEGWERVGSHKFEEFGVQRAWKRKVTSEFVEMADEDLKSVPFE